MLEFINTNQLIIYPILIFLLKTPELCLNSLRIIMTAKGYKFLSALLIFIEACLGLIALTLVFTELDNVINILAFGFGMAMGSYLGIVLEKKIALGIVLARVITQRPADRLLVNLRQLGFRVTEVAGESNYGNVSIIFATVKRSNISNFVDIVTRYNPNAFYTIEEITHVSKMVIKGGKVQDPSIPKDGNFKNIHFEETGQLNSEKSSIKNTEKKTKLKKSGKSRTVIKKRELKNKTKKN